ncbi:MAG: flavoprotein, partial [Alphaproteobacteria bacterium]
RILWIMRKERVEAAFGGEDLDGLPARGALGRQARHLVESGAVEVLTPFRIAELRRGDAGNLRVIGTLDGRPASFQADELVVATGFRPDLAPLREIRLSLDPWLECAAGIGPLIDPNLHSCGTVRPHGARELAHAEHGFFIAGMKSYGRAPTFLLATGHEQVRSIAAELAGDHDAAMRVELVLPETGVCSTRPVGIPAPGEAAAACCGPAAATAPEPPAAAACCGSSAVVTGTVAAVEMPGSACCGTAEEPLQIAPVAAVATACCVRTKETAQ